MLRKNLIVIMHEDQMTGMDAVSMSSNIPGGLLPMDTIPTIKAMISDIRATSSDYLKYGTQIKAKLTSLRKAINITFTQTGVVDFEIKNDDSNELPIYETMYIINTSNEYKKVDCNTDLLPSQVNKDGLFVAPNTMIVLELTYNMGVIEYEIVAREKI